MSAQPVNSKELFSLQGMDMIIKNLHPKAIATMLFVEDEDGFHVYTENVDAKIMAYIGAYFVSRSQTE